MSLPKGYQYTDVTLAYTDAGGAPAPVDGVPAWVCEPADLLDITVAADGMKANIAHGGKAGEAQVTITADADLGGGVKPLVTLVTIECLGGEAVAGTVTLGEPTPIAATPKK